ncbi:hypothetical protein T310_7550, partial [Rasamsonia emersonii CBS 393.64]
TLPKEGFAPVPQSGIIDIPASATLLLIQTQLPNTPNIRRSITLIPLLNQQSLLASTRLARSHPNQSSSMLTCLCQWMLDGKLSTSDNTALLKSPTFAQQLSCWMKTNVAGGNKEATSASRRSRPTPC